MLELRFTISFKGIRKFQESHKPAAPSWRFMRKHVEVVAQSSICRGPASLQPGNEDLAFLSPTAAWLVLVLVGLGAGPAPAQPGSFRILTQARKFSRTARVQVSVSSFVLVETREGPEHGLHHCERSKSMHPSGRGPTRS